MLKCVLFDFDGVIANTEPLHFRAYRETLAPEGLGFSWEEYISSFIGFDDRDAFRAVFTSRGRPLNDERLRELIRAKAGTFVRLVEELGIEAYPGVVELIRALTARYPLGLCSGALRSDIEPVLRRLELEEAFRDRVTADEVHVSKPDPVSYVLCLEKLARRFRDGALNAAHGVAIEDTPAGIEAAKGAGLRVVAVANTHEPRLLLKADRVVESLQQVSVADLEKLAEQDQPS